MSVIKNSSEDRLAVSISGRLQFIKKQDILFIESFGRKIVIHTADQELELYARMEDAMEELGENFFMTHRSYIINLKKVISYERMEVSLDSGVVVPLSRYKYKEFRKACAV